MRIEYQLPRVTPESVGISSRDLLNMVKAMESDGTEMHGIMLARHGKVILEGWWYPHTKDTVHICHSFGKSYVATAVGAACSDGLLTVNDKVVDIFAEEIKKFNITPSANLKNLSVKNILTMSNGMSRHADVDENLIENYLKTSVDLVPGEKFMYNTAGSCMLGEIVRKVTGRTNLLEYLQQRVLDPIGFDMEHFRWMTLRNGLHAAPGVAASTECNLRLGMLYLQNGIWQGRQIIDEDWINEATKKQIDNELDGYGYQLWMYRLPGTFRFSGGHGQDCFMSRTQDVTLAINQATSEPHDVDANLDIVDRFLLGRDLPDSIPEDPDAYRQLVDYMGNRRVISTWCEPIHGYYEGWDGDYKCIEGQIHIHPELCPFGEYNVNREFYSIRDEWVRDLRIKCFADRLRITMDDAISFTARLDGKCIPEHVQSAMPAYDQSCASAVLEKDCIIINQWFFQTCFKTRIWLNRDGDILHVRVRKDRLHDDKPYLWREASFKRMN